MSIPRVVLCGVGGYADLYARLALTMPQLRLVGFVDPYAEKSPRYEQLRAAAPAYASLEAFFETQQADLVIVSSPITFHESQTLCALAHGANVLCEKPAAATPQQVRAMQAAAHKAGRFVNIGYQWSHSPAIHKLKEAVRTGALGRPLRLRTMVEWPRNELYYARAGWAGALRDAQGNAILDCVASNAAAHYLHNMFYILGDEMDSAACPLSLTSELYRLFPIQTYDTCFMRATMPGGAEVLYYASHAVEEAVKLPSFHYAFEKGEALYPHGDGQILVRYADGREELLGDPFALEEEKLLWSLRALQEGARVPCPPQAALPHTLACCAMLKAAPVVDFPREMHAVREGGFRFAKGLTACMRSCYESGRLPSEMGAPWAVAGKEIALSMQHGTF